MILTLVTLTKVCRLDISLRKTGHVLTKPLESQPLMQVKM